MQSTPIKVLLPCLALALASSGTAIGGLVLQAQEDSGPILTISMPGNGQTISLVGSYSQLPDFTFVGFAETSNSPGSTAGQLGGTGTILSVNPGHSLQMVFYDDGFSLPAGPSYSLRSSSGYTAVIGSDSEGDSFFSQSAAGPSLMSLTSSPGHLYSPLGSNDSFDESPVTFSSSPGYVLEQTYRWSSNGTDTVFQPNGSSVVSAAIPEPSSLVLLGVGAVGLFLIHRRRLTARPWGIVEGIGLDREVRLLR